MSDDPDSLILRMLRAIDAKLERVAEDVGLLKARMSAVEVAIGGVNQRLDQVDARLDRLERRAGLIET